MAFWRFWNNKTTEVKPLPVISQPPITYLDVDAAQPPNVPATIKVDFFKNKLARNLINLSRRSDELRSELVRRGLESL